MSYKVLDNQIKEEKISSIYLFFGEEKYLHDFYINKLKEIILKSGLQEINYLLLESENANVNRIIEFCDSYPIMSDKKLLVIKESELLKGKKTDETETLLEYFSNIPDYVHIIFVQDDVNKKVSLYKYLQKNASCIDFKKLDSTQLAKWCTKQIRENNKKIEISTAEYLVEILDGDMKSIKNECLKLTSFINDREIISLEDINLLCQKTLNYNVFEMVDNIALKQLDKAIIKLNEILNSKEPEFKILGLIIWNFNNLLKVKLAYNEGMPSHVISKRFEIGFVNKYLNQINNFSINDLENVLIKCAQADNQIKTTGLDNRIILEKLIVEIAS